MLQLHTDLQDGVPSGMNAMQGSMSPIQGGSTPMQSGLTPMQADQSNLALIPQRPEHMMLQQEGIETVENPTGARDVTNSSVRGLLARNLGYYIVASVGNDYLVIYQPDQNRFVSGDIYALKFVEFHEDQSACAGYRRRDAFHGW